MRNYEVQFTTLTRDPENKVQGVRDILVENFRTKSKKSAEEVAIHRLKELGDRWNINYIVHVTKDGRKI